VHISGEKNKNCRHRKMSMPSRKKALQDFFKSSKLSRKYNEAL
jgi:hypothetical protein